ncbi:hypothetical protein PVE40_12415, partial [Jeotgalibaca sp. YN-L-12]|nr:hypothetical protein [Jeotgalibaca caeni]
CTYWYISLPSLVKIIAEMVHFRCRNHQEAVEDFSILFPNKLLTVSMLYDFCGKQVSKRIIRTTLKKKYERIQKSCASYYR